MKYKLDRLLTENFEMMTWSGNIIARKGRRRGSLRLITYLWLVCMYWYEVELTKFTGGRTAKGGISVRTDLVLDIGRKNILTRTA